MSETRGPLAEDSRRLHAQQGPVGPGADSTVPREGRLHRQGVGGVVHVAQVQDHEEQILRLVNHYIVMLTFKPFMRNKCGCALHIPICRVIARPIIEMCYRSYYACHSSHESI